MLIFLQIGYPPQNSTRQGNSRKYFPLPATRNLCSFRRTLSSKIWGTVKKSHLSTLPKSIQHHYAFQCTVRRNIFIVLYCKYFYCT